MIVHALDDDVAMEALDCVAVRARWYETRGIVVPQRTMRALQALARHVGVDPQAARKR